jgi:hypothetical protein
VKGSIMNTSHHANRWAGDVRASTILAAILVGGVTPLLILLASLTITPRDLESSTSFEIPDVNAVVIPEPLGIYLDDEAAAEQDREDTMQRKLAIEAGQPL